MGDDNKKSVRVEVVVHTGVAAVVVVPRTVMFELLLENVFELPCLPPSDCEKVMGVCASDRVSEREREKERNGK